MKYLLFCSLLLSVNLFSQSNYTIPKNATIYDLPDGEFISAISIDDTVFIKHYNELGNAIWEGSLPFFPPISPVYFSKIAHFKNTNECLIISFADPSPNTPFWLSFYNDTLVFQFTKINLNNHVVTGNLIDTFSCKSMDLVELNDSSIYLLFTDYSYAPSPFNQATYSLNSAMDLTQIAPLDSVVSSPWTISISVFGNSIYRHQSLKEFHVMDKYNFQMSLLESNGKSIAASQIYNPTSTYSCFYKKMLNKDSLFIFTQGSPAGWVNFDWRMDWLSPSLDFINSLFFHSPSTEDPLIRVYSDFNKVAIDRRNQKIMVLTNDQAPSLSMVFQKIFVYDFEFNFVCEIPITFGGDAENSLIELNDFVYLRNDNALNSELLWIDCSMLAMEEMTTQSEFELFPNPTRSSFSISNPEKKMLSIVVLSSSGKKLMHVSGQESSISLDLSELPLGMYLVEISTHSTTEVKRIIKE